MTSFTVIVSPHVCRDGTNHPNDGEWRLYIGTRFTGVTVVADDRWPDMWRIRQGDRLSDMVNLARAKDAALSWARADGWKIDVDHMPRWKSKACVRPPLAPRIEQTPALVPSAPPALTQSCEA